MALSKPVGICHRLVMELTESLPEPRKAAISIRAPLYAALTVAMVLAATALMVLFLGILLVLLPLAILISFASRRSGTAQTRRGWRRVPA